MLRGLVRQQEDATRLLGEKMRNEAQEHVSKRQTFEILSTVTVEYCTHCDCTLSSHFRVMSTLLTDQSQQT